MSLQIRDVQCLVRAMAPISSPSSDPLLGTLILVRDVWLSRDLDKSFFVIINKDVDVDEVISHTLNKDVVKI